MDLDQPRGVWAVVGADKIIRVSKREWKDFVGAGVEGDWTPAHNAAIYFSAYYNSIVTQCHVYSVR